MTKPIYDEHYLNENYFGAPYPGLVKFFKKYDRDLSILDLGCGQGRDALFLGRLGYKVRGIDISKVGINQMNKQASKENLDVTGEVADVFKFSIPEHYDLVLLDSMLHFYKNDIEKEYALVKRIAEELKVSGILFNCMLKGAKREKHLKSALKELPIEWEIIADTYTNYPESNSTFHMYVVKKVSE